MTIAVSTQTRPTPDLVILVGGQSLADFLTYTGAGDAFIAALRTHSDTPDLSGALAFVELVDQATGGSFAVKAHADAETALTGLPTSYWYNIAGSASGPLLTAAVSAIGALSAKPTIIVWDQGQADTAAASGAVDGISAATAAADYKTATEAIFSALRSACNPGSPTSVPIFMAPLGRRASSSPSLGYEAIRQKQLEIIAGGTNIHRALEVYDLDLKDVVHPNRAGRRIYGTRIAETVARISLGGDDIFAGPSISGVTLDNSTTLRVAISVEAGDSLVKPANPYGFRVEQSGSQVPVASMAWSGNDLLLTLASPVTTPDLFFPYDFVADFDPAKTITGSVSGKPLQSWYRA